MKLDIWRILGVSKEEMKVELRKELKPSTILITILSISVGILILMAMYPLGDPPLLAGLLLVVTHVGDSYFTYRAVKIAKPEKYKYLEYNGLLCKFWEKFGLLKGELIFSLFSYPVMFFLGYGFVAWYHIEHEPLLFYVFLFTLWTNIYMIFGWGWTNYQLKKNPSTILKNIEDRKHYLSLKEEKHG